MKFTENIGLPVIGCLENTDLENTDLENADLENTDLENRRPRQNTDLPICLRMALIFPLVYGYWRAQLPFFWSFDVYL